MIIETRNAAKLKLEFDGKQLASIIRLTLIDVQVFANTCERVLLILIHLFTSHYIKICQIGKCSLKYNFNKIDQH